MCPACHKDTIVVEYKSIELDYCTECHGVWFDSGELELLLKVLGTESRKLLLDSLLGKPEPSRGEKKRRCPICRRKLKKVALGEQPAIIIDICPQDDGLWFDGGELAALLSQLAPQPQTAASPASPQQQVTDFLREVFQSTACTTDVILGR